jgi:Holliday junction DNA helicase RuvA
MIGYLNGKIIQVDGTKFIVEVAGVGYLVNVTAVLLSEYKIGQQIELFIQPEIREDAFELFGFKTTEQKSFYKKIRSVNGVGPKTALNIMSLDVDDLTAAIEAENVKKLCTVPGLGKKTAERLILELKGNLPSKLDEPKKSAKFNTDVVMALENFGYKEKEILKVFETMPADISDEQAMIKFFLQNIR